MFTYRMCDSVWYMYLQVFVSQLLHTIWLMAEQLQQESNGWVPLVMLVPVHQTACTENETLQFTVIVQELPYEYLELWCMGRGSCPNCCRYLLMICWIHRVGSLKKPVDALPSSPHTDAHITERRTYIPMHSFKEAVVNSLLQWNDSPGRASAASCTSDSQGWSSEHWTQFRNNDIFSKVVERSLIFWNSWREAEKQNCRDYFYSLS